MQRTAQVKLRSAALTGRAPRSTGWVKRAVVILGLLWAVLLAGFGTYYFLDQQAIAAAPQDTALARALEKAEDAVRRNPGNSPARMAVADLYVEAGRFQEAADQYLEVMRGDAGNLPAANGLAASYLALGESERAVPVLQRAIRQNQELKVVRTSGDMGEAHLRLGQVYLSQGRAAEARSEAEAALQTLPADADALLLLGNSLARGGDLAGAVERYRSALRLVPRFLEAYEAMVTAYEGMGDGARAAYARAMVTYSRGSYDRAAQELEALVRTTPSLPEGRLGLGMAFERLGKTVEAAAQYREALRLEPGLDYAVARLATLEQK